MAEARARTDAIPVWGALAATSCMFIGWNWDICWHRCIGRDTLWTLPHIAIYIALFIAFCYNTWLILSHTFGRRRDWPSLKVMGFRGPGSSFITLWAILAQFSSIVFDDWWHNVYGLDSQVFTPPHFVLGTGIGCFYIGQIILVATYGNTIMKDRPMTIRWVYLLMWALALGNSLVGADALYGPLGIRAVVFLASASLIVCFCFASVFEYLQWRWAILAHAGLYMLVVITLMQIFQFFPATPQFGPVFHRVTTFAPPPFPLWLVIPAAATTLVIFRPGSKPRLVRYLAVGMVFAVALTLANWGSSAFLSSEWSHNRFFAGDYPAAAFYESYKPVSMSIVPRMGLPALVFLRGELSPAQSLLGGAGVVVMAGLMAALGLWSGRGMGRWLRVVKQ